MKASRPRACALRRLLVELVPAARAAPARRGRARRGAARPACCARRSRASVTRSCVRSTAGGTEVSEAAAKKIVKPMPISTSANRFSRMTGVAGLPRSRSTSEELPAEPEQHQEHGDLGADHDAVGGAVEGLPSRRYRSRPSRRRSSRMQATPAIDMREKRAPTSRQPAPSRTRASARRKHGHAADPDRGAELVQRLDQQQQRAVVEPRGGVGGERRGGQLDGAAATSSTRPARARRARRAASADQRRGAVLTMPAIAKLAPSTSEHRQIDRADQHRGLQRDRRRLAQHQRRARSRRRCAHAPSQDRRARRPSGAPRAGARAARGTARRPASSTARRWSAHGGRC